MKRINDICYSPATGQCLDIYLPEADTFPVTVYIHGGGLEFGDKDTLPEYMNYMTEHGIAVVSINYRMYPDANIPSLWRIRRKRWPGCLRIWASTAR